MQPDDQKFCLLFAQEINNNFDAMPFDQMSAKIDPVLVSQGVRLLLQGLIDSLAIIFQSVR